MSEIKLFELKPSVKERHASSAMFERELQNLIETNMERFFGVKLLKSEYVITNGRMDSIGIDEDHSPVIFEYKRHSNENVINQGLFYLDWLLDHKADFKILVQEKLGIDEAKKIDWSVPRVICIANDFTRYDLHAVNQMQRNIMLVRYRKYDKDLILFEFLNNPSFRPIVEGRQTTIVTNTQRTHASMLESASATIKSLYTSLCDYIESLGADLTAVPLKHYLAYKKVQNVFCIELFKNHIALNLKIDPDTVDLEAGFIRDVRNTGHHGTGNLEITIKTDLDLEKAKPIIDRAYSEA